MCLLAQTPGRGAKENEAELGMVPVEANSLYLLTVTNKSTAHSRPIVPYRRWEEWGGQGGGAKEKGEEGEEWD